MMEKDELDLSLQASKKELDKKLVDILRSVHAVCAKHHLTYFLFDGTLLGAVRHKGIIPWDDDIDIAMPRMDFENFIKIAQHELGKDFFVQTTETDNEYHIYSIPLKVRDNHSTFIEEYGKNYHQGIYIDIFPLDTLSVNLSRDRFNKKIIRTLEIAKAKMAFHDFFSVKWVLRTIANIGGCFVPHAAIQALITKAKKDNQNAQKTSIYTYGFETPWIKEFSEKDLFPPKLIEFEKEYFFAPNNPTKILELLFKDYMTLPPEHLRIPHNRFYAIQRLF